MGAPGFQPICAPPFGLELTIPEVIFRAPDIAPSIVKEMRALGDFSGPRRTKWLAEMTPPSPDVKGRPHHRVHLPGAAFGFCVNGRRTARCATPLSPRCFGIWFHRQRPNLRDAPLACAGVAVIPSVACREHTARGLVGTPDGWLRPAAAARFVALLLCT